MSNTTKKNQQRRSKFLSLLLRHKPQTVGLVLDEKGWAKLNDLTKLTDFTISEINSIVEECDKKRYSISADGEFIRANQGHSIDVDLELEPQTPPPFLFHGTASRFMNGIMENGLMKQKRQHVHLSADKDTAFRVATRHGSPILFRIDTQKMIKDGYQFFISENEVWLTDSVPVDYLEQDNFE